MAPSCQTQHVIAVTLPTIAVIFLTYLWYKKRSNSVSRSRNDSREDRDNTCKEKFLCRDSSDSHTISSIGGGGNGRSSNSNSINSGNAITMPSVTIPSGCTINTENFPEVMKNAMQKAIRDLETASPIQEICSDNSDDENGEATSATERVETRCDYVSAQTYSQNHVNQSESDDDVEKSTASKDVETIEIGTPHKVENTVGDMSNDNRVKNDISDVSDLINDGQTLSLSPSPSSLSLSSRQVDKSGEYKSTSTINAKKCIENTISHQSENNVETAIEQLVTLRLEKKPKPKPKHQTQQQQQQLRKTNVVTENYKPAEPMATTTTTTILETQVSPTIGGIASSQLLTSPSSSSSKSRKRKSKKKKMTHDCGGGSGGDHDHDDSDNETVNDDQVISTKKTAVDTNETMTTKIDACDSGNAFDASKTVATNMTCAYSCRVPENDAYRHSSKEDDIRCTSNRANSDKTDDYERKVVEHERADCDNERDSANHSPVDTMLDCQSIQFSDAHSEGSSDSGKGCSEDAASPTPQTPAGGSSISGDANIMLLYQFVIPQKHVGKLIGKYGQFINNIKITSNTSIYIKEHPTSYKKKICALEGTQQEIQKALDLIRIRFPEATYPDITLEEFNVSLPMPCPLRPDLFQLDLVEGVNNDVLISSVVNAGHLFLQQPMHPTYQSLTLLNLNMNQVYNSPEAPVVLEPIKDTIVAAPAMDGWYRAQIVSVDDETESCQVRFLDYGGYLSLSTSCLKAVRADFLTLPFQAVECYLANIAPVDDIWSEEAKLIVQSLTYGHILQAQVYDYTSEGIPLILLYAKHGTQVILINQELVARGFAYPITSNSNDGLQSEEYYAYS